MEVPIQGNSDIMRYQELVNTFGQMVKCMKASGKITKCMAEEHSYGEMVKGTKDSLCSTKEKVMVLSNGKTVESMKDNGKTVNNMELEYSRPRIIKLKRVNGLMAKR